MWENSSGSHRRAHAATLAAVLLLAAIPAEAKTITQVMDPSGDGAGHPLTYPTAIAADSSGNVFVSGFESDNVLQMTPDRTITQILDASGDGAGHAIDGVARLAVGADDTIYVAGFLSVNILKRTAGGSWTQVLDATGDGAGHTLTAIDDMAVDSAGNLYVSDEYGPHVFRITPGGAISVVLDATGDGAGNTLQGPSPLAIDADDNLYVGSRTDRVFRVTPSGIVSVAAVDQTYPRVRYIWDIAIDTDGNLLVGNLNEKTVVRVTPGGVYSIISYNLETIQIGTRDDLVLVSNYNNSQMLGFRPAGPTCVVMDASGDGTHPFWVGGYFVVVGTERIYVLDEVYGTVYRIDHACEGPTLDMNGRWFVSTTSNGVTPGFDALQDWVQSGLSVTVSNPDTAQVLYTGIIDDSNRFSLQSPGSHCGTFGCCADTTFSGQLAADGLTFTGGHAYSAGNCRGGLGDSAVGSRCGNQQLDGTEECDDGNATAGDGCDSSCMVEPCAACSGVPSVCGANVRVDCAAETQGGAVSFTMKQGDGERPGRLKWRLLAGPVAELGDPTAATDYRLCVFDVSAATPSVLFTASVPAGAGWGARGVSSFRYRSRDAGPDGIATVKLQSSTASRITMTGKGPSLVLPSPPLALPMLVQLQSSDAGCFQSSYLQSGAADNDANGAKLSADP